MKFIMVLLRPETGKHIIFTFYKLMKRVILLIGFIVSALGMHADDYPYLAFQNTDGEVTILTANGLTLSYADGVLTAVTGGSSQTFETSKLSRMYFTDTATGIVSLNADGKPQAVEVFTADGRNLGRFASLQEAAKRLPKGAYVVKANGQTIKIALQ